MSGDAVSTAVGLRNLPEAIRSLGALANPDYVDLYTVTTSEATEKSPEDWARAALVTHARSADRARRTGVIE